MTQLAIYVDWNPRDLFKSKEIMCLMNWNRDTKKCIFYFWAAYLKGIMKGVLHRIVTGNNMWIFYGCHKGKDTALCLVNYCHRYQHQHQIRMLMGWKTSYVTDWTNGVLYNMKFCDSITDDQCSLHVIRLKNGQNTSKGMTNFIFFKTTLGHMS